MVLKTSIFLTSLSSEGDPVSGAERVQQQNVEHVRHQHVDVPVLQVFSQHFEVGTLSEKGSATTCLNIDETTCVPAPHGVDQVVCVSVPHVDEQQISTQNRQQTVEQEIDVSAMIFQHVDVSASFVPYEPLICHCPKF